MMALTTDPSGGPAADRISAEDYEAAARRVRERIAFYGHVTWYFWLNLLFACLNAVLTPGTWWCAFLAIFWGAVVLAHLVAVFFIADLNGPYSRRILRRELQRLRGRRGDSP